MALSVEAYELKVELLRKSEDLGGDGNHFKIYEEALEASYVLSNTKDGYLIVSPKGVIPLSRKDILDIEKQMLFNEEPGELHRNALEILGSRTLYNGLGEDEVISEFSRILGINKSELSGKIAALEICEMFPKKFGVTIPELTEGKFLGSEDFKNTFFQYAIKAIYDRKNFMEKIKKNK